MQKVINSLIPNKMHKITYVLFHSSRMEYVKFCLDMDEVRKSIDAFDKAGYQIIKIEKYEPATVNWQGHQEGHPRQHDRNGLFQQAQSKRAQE